jgi:hypothetical protein
MTDQINERNPFDKRLSSRLQHIKKPSANNIHLDVNGILTLTEKQCRHDCYKIVEKNYSTAFSQFLQVSTRGKKSLINAYTKPQEIHGMAHRLTSYCITFKIVQL